jgi:opacity protein-like surface antigen
MCKNPFIKFSWLATLLLVLISATVAAQEQSCSFTLKEAQNLYRNGAIEKIPALIAPCMKKGFSRQEQQDAYKLLLLCYLFDDEQGKADSSMVQFLRQYPEYEINPTDTREFVYLFNSYRNLPIFSIGLIGGTNISQCHVVESYNTGSLSGAARSYKHPGLGFHFGLQLNTYLAEHYELGLGIMFLQNTFQTADYSLFLGTRSQQSNYTETQKKLEFPIFLRYDFNGWKKFVPYLRAGLVPSWLISANGSISNTYPADVFLTPVSSPTLDITGERKKFGFGVLAGAGIKYAIPRLGNVFIDIKYQPGLSAQLSGTSMNASENLFKYQMVNDNIRLNQFAFSLGFSHSFYRPIKKQSTQP